MRFRRGTGVAARSHVHSTDDCGRIWVIALILSGTIICGIAAPRASRISFGTPSFSEIIAPANDDSVDLYGNEVRPAVALYKVDPAGALYEEHSPETEVPRLGSPKG
jgi:hypothetical protein